MIYKTKDDNEIEVNSFGRRVNGKPTLTRYGLLRQPSMSEWDTMMECISLLNKYPDAIKNDLLQLMIKGTNNKKILKRFRDNLMEHDVVYFMLQDKFKLGTKINSIIDFLFIEKSEYISSIIFESDESWNEFRLYILDFYGWNQESESGDEEVKRFQDLKKYLDKEKGRQISYEVMYTVVMEWYSPEQINNLTIYQFRKFFDRMVKKESHRTTALFKTVDSTGDYEVVNYLESEEKERKISFLNITGSDVGDKEIENKV